MPRTRFAAATLATALLAACAPDATAPRAAVDAPAIALDRAATSAAIATGPTALFLPPLAPQPVYDGPFDATVLDRLAVEVCALDAAATRCAAPPLQRSTSTVGASPNERIRLNAAREMYLVYWNTGANGVVATTNYRVRVLLGGVQVGTLDVDVVPTAADLAGVDRTRFVGVVLGAWAPLNFRVEQPTTAPKVASSLVNEIAAGFQDAVAAGATRDAAIRELLGALVRIVPATDAGNLDAYRAQGLPVVLDEQVATLGRAFGDRSLVDVDQFIAAASAAGARTQGGAALTRAYLTQQLQPVANLAEHDAATILPAVVMALGRERARKANVPIDPVWGDGLLDPLQTLLLYYAFNFSGGTPGATAVATPNVASPVTVTGAALRAVAAPTAAPTAALALPSLPALATRFGPGIGRSVVTGIVGTIVEMPLTPVQAVGTSVCGSILLYGHRFQLQAQATDVERKHAHAKRPVTTEITATLTFDFTPNAAAKLWLATPLIGCTLPPNGPAAARTVQWTMNQPLGQHGALHGGEGSYTDGAGRAFATYRTFDEPVPEVLHPGLLQKSATGTVDVRAKGLIPGWSNLERSVGAGVHNPTDAGIRLNVFYYDLPRIQYHMASEIRHQQLFAGTYVSTVDVTVNLEARTSPSGYRYYAGIAPITRSVAYTEAGFQCNSKFSGMETPSQYAVVVTFPEDGEVATYVNSPFWRETWQHAVPTPGGCGYQAQTGGNYMGVDWQTFHISESLFSNPFQIADFPFPFLFRLAGWERLSPGNVLQKTYTRINQLMREETTIELRIAP